MLRPLLPDDPTAIGTFVLHGRLGEGGMGVVFQGFGPDGTVVAIKMPHTQLARDPEFRARFRQEVTAAQRVHGRRIAEVVDADIEAERPWLANSFVSGESMAEAIRERGAMSSAQLYDFASGLAEALECIHGADVIHRDLKPDNIILTWDGPRVIDFGIARIVDATRLTEPGRIIGTLAWMPPEMLGNQEVGPPADIFAWGALVAFAATGRPPFHADTQAAVIARIIRDDPDLTEVPGRYRRMVLAAMTKDPDARPTARELVDFLAAQAKDERSNRRKQTVAEPADEVTAPNEEAHAITAADEATARRHDSVPASNEVTELVAAEERLMRSTEPQRRRSTSARNIVVTPADQPVVNQVPPGPPVPKRDPHPRTPMVVVITLLSLSGFGLVLGPVAIIRGFAERIHARRAFVAPPASAARWIRLGWIAIVISVVALVVAFRLSALQ
ncbi:serine/threonine-protein kinase [Nocardia pseudovaccinii]|uniref:serine/threonine-protein kinase n=1 Tax=Nocardia pseudovaccinii TaxID=189540 RepID=UPI0007A5583E|nr:serine/threonine-protein kinase [Nocardia pseudovaccinii]